MSTAHEVISPALGVTLLLKSPSQKKTSLKVVKILYVQGNAFFTLLGNQPILSFERVKGEKRLFLHIKA